MTQAAAALVVDAAGGEHDWERARPVAVRMMISRPSIALALGDVGVDRLALLGSHVEARCDRNPPSCPASTRKTSK